MAAVSKDISAVGAICGPIDVPQDQSGGGSLQYPVGGTGTVVCEVIVDGQDPTVAGNWVAVKLKNANTGLDVDNAAAAGIYNFETWGYSQIRARKSASAGACNVSLGWAH